MIGRNMDPTILFLVVLIGTIVTRLTIYAIGRRKH